MPKKKLAKRIGGHLKRRRRAYAAGALVGGAAVVASPHLRRRRQYNAGVKTAKSGRRMSSKAMRPILAKSYVAGYRSVKKKKRVKRKRR